LKLQEHLSTAGVPDGLEAVGPPRGGKDIEQVTSFDIKCVLAFYPPTDFTHTRAERHATNVRPDQALPSIFTDLFDSCYLYPPDVANVASPYLSPGVADSELLSHLPLDMVIVTCEFDDLRDEGRKFVKRLQTELGKNVTHIDVPGATHAWDKSPNPLTVQPGVDATYKEAIAVMNTALAR